MICLISILFLVNISSKNNAGHKYMTLSFIDAFIEGSNFSFFISNNNELNNGSKVFIPLNISSVITYFEEF